MQETIWIIFLAALGACIGSFLNVVAYRLPRGESLISPGSHCPACGTPIRWYDNLPVFSYLFLRGKCRFCHGAISPRYALVELSTAMIFVALYDVFYKSQMYLAVDPAAAPVPVMIFAMHLCLMAGLVVCSVLDIEYYLIDLRIIYVVVGLGLIGWLAGWNAGQEYPWVLSRPVLLAASLGAIFGEVARQSILKWSADGQKEGEGEVAIAKESEPNASPKTERTGVDWQLVFMSGFIVFGLALIVWGIVGAGRPADYLPRAWGYLIWLFLAILIGLTPKRDSDMEIVEIIEQEKTGARRQAVWESVHLLPAIVGAAAGVFLMSFRPGIAKLVERFFELQVAGFSPMAGLCAGLTGMLVAVGFGWFIRIGFTLLFGKEAMGVGDIYILAAVGAIAGPRVTILGFFLGSIVGVLGIVVLLLWKTSRALSFGPWIAVGTLMMVLFYRPIVTYLRPAAEGLGQVLRGG
jgi:leader peptidase (prepilin peptidase)/N-methyltransferase